MVACRSPAALPHPHNQLHSVEVYTFPQPLLRSLEHANQCLPPAASMTLWYIPPAAVCPPFSSPLLLVLWLLLFLSNTDQSSLPASSACTLSNLSLCVFVTPCQVCCSAYVVGATGERLLECWYLCCCWRGHLSPRLRFGGRCIAPGSCRVACVYLVQRARVNSAFMRPATKNV